MSRINKFYSYTNLQVLPPIFEVFLNYRLEIQFFCKFFVTFFVAFFELDFTIVILLNHWNVISHKLTE